MKKIIVIILCLFSLVNLYAYDEYASPPVYQFQSTSRGVMQQSTYSIPFAAENINIESNGISRHPRRARGTDDDDDWPGYNPNDPPYNP